MKTINETFTDEEYLELKEVKRKMTWHNFIMKLKDYIDNQKEVNENNGTGQSIGNTGNELSSE